MALEKTTLSGAKIRALLSEHYGITAKEIKRMPISSANCYVIQTSNTPVFLKEYQSGFSKESVEREALLLEHLSKSGVHTARFMPTKRGGFVLTSGSHPVVLQEHVAGETYSYDSFPRALLPALARELGTIHTVLKDYPLSIDMDTVWINEYSPEESAAFYEDLMVLAGKQADDANILQLLGDLQYKKELALRCKKYETYFDGVTYGGTHGDYQGCQVIGEKGSIRAVVDFSSARVLPLSWEIMRSFAQSSDVSRQNATIDCDALCDYVREYLKVAPLTHRDLEAMPYVYLYQLARSRYGFRQYLTTDSEDRESLLRFAFWRPDMCRHLEEHAKAISDKLLELCK